jgi:hypothetical protein
MRMENSAQVLLGLCFLPDQFLPPPAILDHRGITWDELFTDVHI